MTSRSPDQSSQGVVAIRGSPPNSAGHGVAQRLPYIKIGYTRAGTTLSMVWSRGELEGMNYAHAASAIRAAVIQNHKFSYQSSLPDGPPRVYAKVPFMDQWLALPESQWEALIGTVIELRISFRSS